MPDHDRAVVICASAALADGGKGVRFPLITRQGPATGFAVRFEGRVHAYLNRCAHLETELDWQLGEFFDHAGLYLVCATHGALYAPESGRCEGGPCQGRSLLSLAVLEHDSLVYWLPDSPSSQVATVAD